LTKRAVLVEVWLAACIFGAATWWGTSYWNASWKAGRVPQFYQEYFEPAVMVACGKGFVIATPAQIPAMADFLNRKTDRFACVDIPASTQFISQGLYQEPIRYLMLLVAGAWRMLGISWSGLGPLSGVLFGLTILASYGIFRLGMGQLLALFGAFGLSISTLHLLNLPHLRDYAKAPFTLLLIFVLGLLITLRPRPRVVLALSAAYGVILGIGYGIRTDLLIGIPPLLIVLFGFLEDGPFSHVKLKLAAAGVFALSFLLVAWPILSSTYRNGGCQWHVTLLGFNSEFTEALDLEPGPYDWGHVYSDMFVYKTISTYAFRLSPSAPRPSFCSHDYDVATGRYLATLAATFPADMLTRGYASALEIVQLPFPWHQIPLAGRADALYQVREPVLEAWAGSGLFLVVAALLVAASRSLRVAWFLLFFLLYFGGYPALQFANRHHFHLEFITWWAFGFLVDHFARREFPHRQHLVSSVTRAAAFAGMAAVVLLAPQAVLRLYQQGATRSLLAGYVGARKDEIRFSNIAPGVLQPIGDGRGDAAANYDPRLAQFLEVDLNASRCGDRATVTFRYDPKDRSADFSRTFTIEHDIDRQDFTRVFAPVYDHFLGLEFSEAAVPCVDGVYRIAEPGLYPVQLFALLKPRWNRDLLYQQIRALVPPNVGS
jgi:hypothetical protein